jgi:hypothetical protein
MRGHIVSLVLVGAFGLVADATLSETQQSFDVHSLAEVKTLAALPDSILSALGGHGGIADRGAPFNATDALSGPWPMRRFVLGSVSTCCVLVAYEQGGRGYSVQVRGYVHSATGWSEVRHWTLSKPPTGLEDLLKRIEAGGDGV